MWYPVFILLISIGALLCDEDQEECFSKQLVKQKCEPSKNVSYPETANDLLTFCKRGVASFYCVIQANETCGRNVPDMQRRAFNFLQTVCDKDNPTFKVVSHNLKCMKQYQNYKGLCKQKFNPIEDHKRRIYKEDEKAGKCLSDLVSIRCTPITVGYICNSDELKEVIKEVLEFDERHLKECTWVNLEKLNPILEEYDAILLDELGSFEKGRGL